MMATADWAIAHGDALFVLSHLPSGIAQTCVTSPPYFGLRSYGTDPLVWPAVSYAPMPGLPELVIPAMSANLGLEDTPEAYIAHLVAIFREVRRVLADTGVAWVNMGDSYATGTTAGRQLGTLSLGNGTEKARQISRVGTPDGLKTKDLMMIPARLALALQADGWWLRSAVVWAKPNGMPESVSDRPSKSYEHIFLLAKSARYFYDAEAIAEPLAESSIKRIQQPGFWQQKGGEKDYGTTGTNGNRSARRALENLARNPSGKNRRDVWTINTRPFVGAHFAVFPPELPDICIRAGTSERGQCPHCGAPWERVVERTPMEIARSERSEQMGKFGRTQTSGTMTKPPTSQTVGWRPTCACPEHEPVPQLILDPFSGAGTTGMVALRLGRRYIGIEPNAEYVRMSERRIIDDAPLFNAAALVKVVEAA